MSSPPNPHKSFTKSSTKSSLNLQISTTKSTNHSQILTKNHKATAVVGRLAVHHLLASHPAASGPPLLPVPPGHRPAAAAASTASTFCGLECRHGHFRRATTRPPLPSDLAEGTPPPASRPSVASACCCLMCRHGRFRRSLPGLPSHRIWWREGRRPLSPSSEEGGGGGGRRGGGEVEKIRGGGDKDKSHGSRQLFVIFFLILVLVGINNQD